MTLKSKQFGEDFLWGVAISAAQNEGAPATDGRGASIWDVFARRQGKIKAGAKPYPSAEFYLRYKNDLLLAKALGFKVFRFSISWSRILPDGFGKINQDGILFYHRLLDECLVLGLTPYVTLYHWDLPQELQKNAGWASHQMQKWFLKFVHVCLTNFGDKVQDWIVLNEPMGFTSLGYALGKHAPGKTSIPDFYSAVHNALICQAEGGRMIRAHNSKAHIGTAFSCSEVMPFSQKADDIQAAIRLDILLNRLFIEPALGRGYPQDDHFPFLEKMQLHNKAWRYTDQMTFNFDFVGIQNYFSLTVKANPIIPYLGLSEVKASSRKVPHTDLGWEVNADSFYRMLKRYWLYGSVKEIIVTEGGAFYHDHLVNGIVDDQKRIQYYQDYLKSLLKAKQEGVNVKGYFAWTLTDNFEWAEGYHARFGLIHVDFMTQLRTIKNSGYWFRDVLFKD